MKNLILTLLVIAITISASPLSAQSTKDAFLDISKSAFKKQFKDLAVMPLRASAVLAMPEQMKQLVMDEVLKKLGK